LIPADAREPDWIDLAVHDMAVRVMAAFDPNSYRLERQWNGEAEMWFTEIEPVNAGPAPISLYHGGDTLNVCFGATWFEAFPFYLGELPEFERLLNAICLGNFEQSANKYRAGARVFTSDRTWRVGHVLWPIPWKWRRKTKYQPYPTIQPQ
jgi:hypothetical protein